MIRGKLKLFGKTEERIGDEEFVLELALIDAIDYLIERKKTREYEENKISSEISLGFKYKMIF